MSLLVLGLPLPRDEPSEAAPAALGGFMYLWSQAAALLFPFTSNGSVGLAPLVALLLLSLASWAAFIARTRRQAATRRDDETFSLAFDTAARRDGGRGDHRARTHLPGLGTLMR